MGTKEINPLVTPRKRKRQKRRVQRKKRKTMFRAVLKQVGQETLDYIRSRQNSTLRLHPVQKDISSQANEIMWLIYGRRKRR